ncbi:SCP domain-containing protein [Trichostrongylus colubriformis]|uniref:SCP domain-containing protein n=1 Tax=Trichostrongylus colubriformis TaxID=6319 RepID=A0AAN8F8S7_TRICO
MTPYGIVLLFVLGSLFAAIYGQGNSTAPGGAGNGTAAGNGTSSGNGTANSTTPATQNTTTTTTTTTTAAPNASEVVNCDSAQLPTSIRQRFLDQHNLRRGSLARGQSEANGNGGLAPPAANMYRMEYSCTAESYAQSHANSCSQQIQPVAQRPGHKTNVYAYSGSGDEAAAAEEAMNSWWSQLALNGIDNNMLFTQAVRSRTSKPVTRWSKMAWWNNLQVGCAINQCDGLKLVVCMYSPGGNDVGKQIYNVGAPCSQCPGQCQEDLCSQ